MVQLQPTTLSTRAFIDQYGDNARYERIRMMMKAIETTAMIDENGQLTLDSALSVEQPQRVRLNYFDGRSR